MENTLYHHGVKGQKWGIRNYQYSDGSLTPKGRKHYGYGSESQNKEPKTIRQKIAKTINSYTKNKTYSKNGVDKIDSYIDAGTEFARIQSSANFEKFAFYATYIKDDQDKYLGLFGNNLINRAKAEANNAEKNANKTNNEDDYARAAQLRDKADNMKVYQLKIEATKKLKIPSDENASDITNNLLKSEEFRNNLSDSLSNAKGQMKRPAQQQLIKQAEKAISKLPDNKLTETEKLATYKALNLTLTFHNSYDIALQDSFYGEMKKKGYNALLDYNDKEYSSYKAKRPTIVFDTDSVKVSSILEPSHEVISELNTKYNAERMKREIPATAMSFVTSKLNTKVDDCYSYVEERTRRYLEAS